MLVSVKDYALQKLITMKKPNTKTYENKKCVEVLQMIANISPEIAPTAINRKLDSLVE